LIAVFSSCIFTPAGIMHSKDSGTANEVSGKKGDGSQSRPVGGEGDWRTEEVCWLCLACWLCFPVLMWRSFPGRMS